jgi:hypothetical protein
MFMRQPSLQEHQDSDFGWVPEHYEAWRRVLGPLLSVDEVQQRLGLVSQREVAELVRRKQLLALPTREGRIVYPAFQFDEQGRVFPDIERIIRIFDGIALTPYTIASWLNGPKDYLDGETPIRWLQLERDVDPVIAGAEVAAARLSH